jgi:hypothetical protein
MTGQGGEKVAYVVTVAPNQSYLRVRVLVDIEPKPDRDPVEQAKEEAVAQVGALMVMRTLGWKAVSAHSLDSD